MKYYKKYLDFNHVSEEDFKCLPIEISRDEFHELCENIDSYFLSHCLEDGVMCHLISVSNCRIK